MSIACRAFYCYTELCLARRSEPTVSQVSQQLHIYFHSQAVRVYSRYADLWRSGLGDACNNASRHRYHHHVVKIHAGSQVCIIHYMRYIASLPYHYNPQHLDRVSSHTACGIVLLQMEALLQSFEVSTEFGLIGHASGNVNI